MIPRVIVPATVRATGDFMICSMVPGGSFGVRPRDFGAAGGVYCGASLRELSAAG